VRINFASHILAAVWFGALVAAAAPQDVVPSASAVPTFTKDVAPILYEHCTTCHRPGEIAPMSLLTYEEARPWARSIQNQITAGRMPPWHADAPAGTFENERRLSEADRNTLLSWVNAGAPKGDLKDLPPVPIYPHGWIIGQPDVVFEMLEDYQVPAKGVVQYEYFYIPTNFTEPKFVQAIEVRPGNRKLVHHVLVRYKVKPDMQRAPVLRPNPALQALPPPTAGLRPQRRDNIPSQLVATYAPGTNPQVFRPGTALRLEPGGVIELQMHYTAIGEAGTDRTQVGMIFSKDPAPREVRTSAFFNTKFTLPAGSSDVRVDADVAILQDITLWGLFPHTHLRGKKWEYGLELPDGTRKVILSVPKYDFNWQTYYVFREPLKIQKGSRIVSTAWYDNSAANRSNPDPKVDVSWGDQTWEEMQYSGLLFSVDSATTAKGLDTVQGLNYGRGF
jgi:hypothetical protein